MPTARALIATINRITREKIEPGTLEQRVLSNRLLASGSVEFNVGGVRDEWPVRFRRIGNFREHDVFQEVNATPEKSEVMVSSPFGRYIQTEFIDDEEKLVNRGQMEKIYDLYRSKSEGMAEDGKDEFHMELHNGTGTGRRIFGLNLLLPVALGTVHGQVQTANPWWIHPIIDATAGPNTDAVTDLLERLRTALISADRGDGAGQPDFGITTPDVYNGIVEKHTAFERYDAMGSAIGPELKGIIVHGKPIFYDKHAEAEVLRYLNPRKMKLAFRTAGMFEADIKRPSNRTGDLLLSQIFPNLEIRNMRYHAVVTNLDLAA